MLPPTDPCLNVDLSRVARGVSPAYSAPSNRTAFNRRNFMAGAVAVIAGAMAPTLGHASAGGQPTAPSDEQLPQVARPGATPNTLFAVNIEMWFKGSLAERLAQASALGFPAIEFWPHENKDIDAMARELNTLGLMATQFTAWGFGRELNHPDISPEKFVQAIETACGVAQRLPGCSRFTVVIGDDIEGLSKTQMHQAAIAKIRKVIPILVQHDKTIIIEPMNPYTHPGHCLYGSADGIALCEAIGSERVKLNWDLFHMQRSEGNLIANLKNGRDFIGYVQIADSPDRQEPGTGEVNFTNVFKTLAEIGYRQPVGLECLPADGDALRAARRIYRADTWG